MLEQSSIRLEGLLHALQGAGTGVSGGEEAHGGQGPAGHANDSISFIS